MILRAILRKYKKTKLAIQLILVLWTLFMQSGLGLYAETNSYPGIDPYTHTTFFMSEEFISGSGSSSQIGTHGWRIASIGAALTLTPQATVTPNIGVLGAITTTTTAQGGGFYLAQSSTASEWWLGRLDTRAGWEINWIFSLTSTLAVSARIGVVSSVSAAEPASGIFLRVDTQNYSDTTFIFESRAASTPTTYNTAITADANFHRLNISSNTAGTVLMRLYSATGVLQASYSFASGLPTSAVMTPGAIIVTGVTGTAKQINLDYFSLLETNLAR